MRLKVLDGAQTVGGTKILAMADGQGVLLDFGLSFSRYQLFFEEFVRPRSTRGLTDLLRFGLIPNLPGAYRPDLMIGMPMNSPSQSVEIAGLLLTHGHVDHVGVAGTLRCDIPIHCTGPTLAILKATQDSGRADFWGEYAYAIPRIAGGRPDVIKSASTSTEAIGRPFVCVGSLTPEMALLLARPASESVRSRSLRASPVVESDGLVGPFRYRHWPVDHSIPGCCSIEITDGEKRILYTGDLRFHGRNGDTSRRMVEEAAINPPDLLVVEGTRLGRKPGPEVTEQQVLDVADEIVRDSRGRLVIADFGARHVERLASFLIIAKAHSRRLVLTAKDVLLLEGLWSAGETMVDPDDPQILIFDEPRAVLQGWEQAILERYPKKLANAKAIRAHPDETILAFSFFDLVELTDISPSGGVYIYSSSEAYSEDQRLDLNRLSNWVREFQFDLRGFRWEGGQTGKAVFDEPLNASGHLSETDLVWLLETIRPKCILPVHTEHPLWFNDIGARIRSKIVNPGPDGEVLVA